MDVYRVYFMFIAEYLLFIEYLFHTVGICWLVSSITLFVECFILDIHAEIHIGFQAQMLLLKDRVA